MEMLSSDRRPASCRTPEYNGNDMRKVTVVLFICGLHIQFVRDTKPALYLLGVSREQGNRAQGLGITVQGPRVHTT